MSDGIGSYGESQETVFSNSCYSLGVLDNALVVVAGPTRAATADALGSTATKLRVS